MAAGNMIYLMYHELELPGRPLCQTEPGYMRYILSENDFRAQIQWLKSEGWQGMSVSQALKSSQNKAVAITFDDGAETDLIAAAQVLKETGFQATFCVTVGFLGKRGYMSASQLRALSGLGFEIGCHSMTHAYLSDLDSRGLRREVVEAKQELEQLVGLPVEHFSCPGGRYDSRTRKLAQEAGYRSVATSQPHPNGPSSDHFALGRVAVMRDTTLPEFQRLCRGQGLWKRQLSGSLRETAKSVLGNFLYDRFRARWLHHRPE
jgi:peptidoglycan/xylan/chitin deacetylase (PgdA/CDA1 family)